MRRKITKPAKASEDDLPDLTEQQREFVHGILQGKTASDAYRAAYNCEDMQPNSIWVAASRLRSDAKVALWLAAARKAELGKASRSKEQHIARLDQLQQMAAESGNYGAAVQAEQLIGKVEGHYVDRLDMNVSGDPAVTLGELEAEFGSEIAQAIAHKYQH